MHVHIHTHAMHNTHAQVKILRALRLVGAGDRETTDAMSDILAQVLLFSVSM